MFGMRFVYTEDRSRMESTIQRIKDRRKAEREQALEQNENDKTKRKQCCWGVAEVADAPPCLGGVAYVYT